jgi:hypothetical protein
MADDDLPEGTVAYREYAATIHGASGSLAFTLGDPTVDTMPARFAKHAGARAYGLISILGFPQAPQFPVIWVQTDEMLGITVADRDGQLTDDLKQLIVRQFVVFFNGIAPIAPELSAVRLKADGRGDRSLN